MNFTIPIDNAIQTQLAGKYNYGFPILKAIASKIANKTNVEGHEAFVSVSVRSCQRPRDLIVTLYDITEAMVPNGLTTKNTNVAHMNYTHSPDEEIRISFGKISEIADHVRAQSMEAEKEVEDFLNAES